MNRLLRSPRRVDLIALPVLGVALALFPLVAPVTAVGVGVYALIYGLAALGLSLLMGLAGQVSLGQAAFFAVGAYTQAILLTRYQVHPLLAAVIAVALAMLVALLVGFPLLRLRGHYLALATLGLGIIVTVVVTEWSFTGATSGIFGVPKPEFNGRRYDSAAEFFWLLVPVVLLALLLARNVVVSRVGRALGAVNDSEVAAECLGVNTFRLRLQVFVLSGGYAGLGGVAFAHWLAVVNPNTANFPLSVKFLLMAVLGGLGTVYGAVVGGFAVEFLDDVLRRIVPELVPGAVGEVQLIGFGTVLTLIMIFLPGGLHQLVQRVGRRDPGRSRGRGSAPPPAGGVGTDPLPGEGTSRDGHSPGGHSPGGDTPGGDSRDGNSPDGDVTDPTVPADRSAAESSPLLVREGRPEPGTVLLRTTGLSRRFGGVVAVDDIGLEVRAGEILALIGPNGAGKTTVFNMLSGVLAPSAGTVELGGRRIEGRKPHVFAAGRATRTFQNLQIFGSSSVVGNVAVGRHLRSRAGLVQAALVFPAVREERAVAAEARRLVDLVGLHDDADRPAADLPFGRQRLVELARALAAEPDLLLLDEPLAGLSGAERRLLARLLSRLRAGGMAIVLVEHDVEAVLALADRVAVLDDGHLIALGPPEQVRHDPAVIAAYLGVEDDDDEAVALAGEVGRR